MAVPRITLVDARIVAEPRYRLTDAGLPVWQPRVVTTDRKQDENGTWVDKDKFFVSVTAYKKLAEHAHASFREGDMMIVMGRLVTNEWTDESGNARRADQVIAESMGPSLVFSARRHESDVRAEQTTPAATAETGW